MVNTTITSLTEKTTPATTDVIPIVDIAGGTVTKKITVANFKTAIIDPAVTAGVATEATTRADEDGFTYIDTTVHSTTSVTEVLKRTFTFNKAVDYVRIHMTCYGGNSTYNGFVGFKKNGTIISQANKIGFAMHGSASGGGMIENYSDGFIYVQNVNAGSGCTFFINQSFAINDTLTLYLKVSNVATTVYVNNIVVEGINNKTTDTTWVTLT